MEHEQGFIWAKIFWRGNRKARWSNGLLWWPKEVGGKEAKLMLISSARKSFLSNTINEFLIKISVALLGRSITICGGGHTLLGSMQITP